MDKYQEVGYKDKEEYQEDYDYEEQLEFEESCLKYNLAEKCMATGKTPIVGSHDIGTFLSGIEFDTGAMTAKEKLEQLSPGVRISFVNGNDYKFKCAETGRPQDSLCTGGIVDYEVHEEKHGDYSTYELTIELDNYILSTIDCSSEYQEMVFGARTIEDGIKEMQEFWNFAFSGNEDFQVLESDFKQILAGICDKHGMSAVRIENLMEPEKINPGYRNSIMTAPNNQSEEILIARSYSNMATNAPADNYSLDLKDVVEFLVVDNDMNRVLCDGVDCKDKFVVIDRDGVVYSNVDFSQELSQLRQERFEMMQERDNQEIEQDREL